jgi:hypothetical protein
MSKPFNECSTVILPLIYSIPVTNRHSVQFAVFSVLSIMMCADVCLSAASAAILVVSVVVSLHR